MEFKLYSHKTEHKFMSFVGYSWYPKQVQKLVQDFLESQDYQLSLGIEVFFKSSIPDIKNYTEHEIKDAFSTMIDFYAPKVDPIKRFMKNKEVAFVLEGATSHIAPIDAHELKSKLTQMKIETIAKKFVDELEKSNLNILDLWISLIFLVFCYDAISERFIPRELRLAPLYSYYSDKDPGNRYVRTVREVLKSKYFLDKLEDYASKSELLTDDTLEILEKFTRYKSSTKYLRKLQKKAS